jgi:Ca2+-binding RTX toxin-like protein
MKSIVVLLAATGMILALFAGVALAKIINGNDRDNMLFGPKKADNIRGLGGEDMIFGLDGGDTLTGGRGRDNVFGATATTRSKRSTGAKISSSAVQDVTGSGPTLATTSFVARG